MNRALRIVELLWLGVAAVSAVEVYFAWEQSNMTRSIQFSLFLGVAIFMYFLRRRSRIKAMNKD
jgi:membrane protein implicated in regulation of membrane protease activity